LKPIILGTAGHIDHGKTSLIKAITGVNTDRLKEEQERGITIELGFAALDLPNGRHLGIVDVPGHEKFVKNMVAGAAGIDLVAMVIAADEGVMPQTREHFEICKLLGVRHGLVVLTKIDLVDEEWLELVQEDVKEFLQGSFLEGAPVLPVSSATGDGLEAFIQGLTALSDQVPERSAGGLFRLPVDRVFTMKGFGTVITGTLVSGQIGLGETVMLYPGLISSKVRGLQVHNHSVERAEAGQRTAINFQGLDRAAARRGDVVALPGSLMPSYMLDVSFEYLAGNTKPLKNRTRVRFHTGTSEVLGVLTLLGREELLPGEKAIVQVRLESPLSVVRNDRYVIRSYSPVYTIGGGTILNPMAPKHKGLGAEALEHLKALEGDDPEEIIGLHLEATGYGGISFSTLKVMTNLTDKNLNTALQGMLSRRRIMQIDKDRRVFIHAAHYQRLEKEMHACLADYHQAFPLKSGMSKEEWRSKFPQLGAGKLFMLVLNKMVRDKTVVQEENSVRLAAHKVSLGMDQAEVRQKILAEYEGSGLTPPYFREVVKNMELDPGQARDVLLLLVEEGVIIKTKEDLYFSTKSIDQLKGRLVEFLTVRGEISTPQFKEMTGVSRKYVIPLIEYFDSQNVTIRIGDVRRLRRA